MPLADRLRPPSSPREALALSEAQDVAGALGLDASGAGVLRASTAVLVGLPAAGVLVRVDHADRAGDARRQVVVGRALADRGVPAARLVEPEGQPHPVAGGVATVWRWAEPAADLATPEDLGLLARQLHRAFAAPEGRPDLPELDPLAATARHLAEAEGAGATAPGDLARLRAALAEAAEGWRAAAPHDPLGRSLVHGDLHGANVVVTAGGPVLVDLELSGLGPPSYDLVPALVAVRRYRRPEAGYERFVAAYGADLRDWPEGEALVRVYELSVTAWAVATRTVSPTHEAEAAKRLRRLAGGPDEPWDYL